MQYPSSLRGVSATSTAGRKRDPRVDGAVKQAALDLYAANGWLGFSFEAVAREAGVGKPAVYLRYPTREQLLEDALSSLEFPRPHELGSFTEELHELAHQLADWWLDGSGRITMRMLLESATFPELAAIYDRVVRRPGAAAARTLGKRAVARGELAPGTDASMISELLTGGILTHFVFTRRRAGGGRAAVHAHADQLAEAVLRAFPPAA